MGLIHRIHIRSLSVWAIAVLVYVNTLSHGFVLDDDIVLVRNQYVQAGIQGLGNIFTEDSFAGFERMEGQGNTLPGGRYRPLSLAVFALLYEVVGLSPAVFHGLAVLVFGVLCLLIYRWLRQIFTSSPHGEDVAFGAALLFAVHPVHTEVVANVKSLDESLALLLAIAACGTVFRSSGSRSWFFPAMGGILTCLACLAKEQAIVLMVLAPLSVWFFSGMSTRSLVRMSLPVWIGGLAYLTLRAAVISQPEIAGMPDPLNNPFLTWSGTAWTEAGGWERAATICSVFARQAGLMVWPVGLTHDYYPFHLRVADFRQAGPWIGLGLIVSAVVWMIMHIRRRHPAAFGISWFLIALLPTANVFVNVGTFMAERFLFFPSLGVLIAAGYLLVHTVQWRQSRYALKIVSGLVLLLAVGTVSRNVDWASNESLLRSAEGISDRSAKWRNDMGTMLLDSALAMPSGPVQTATLDTALGHLHLATELHPTYYDAWLAQGACAYYLGRYAGSLSAYRHASTLFPRDPKARLGLLYALRAFGAAQAAGPVPAEAVPVLREAWGMEPDTASATALWRIFRNGGQPDSAAIWLDKALRLAPGDPRLENLQTTSPPAH